MKHTAPIRLAIILASARAGRFGPVVARWFVTQVDRLGGFEVDLIDVLQDDLHIALTVADEDRIAAVSARLAGADAFVVITPEYNHSFPAPLKSLIDWHVAQWRAKPVGFVCYGGISQGLRAVEQLRLVFAELHTVTVRDTVSFHSTAGVFGADGQPSDPGSTVAAKTMLEQLLWWSGVLREARADHPYGG